MMARNLATLAILLACLPTQNLLAAENLPDLRGIPTIVYSFDFPRMVFTVITKSQAKSGGYVACLAMTGKAFPHRSVPQ